MCLTAFDFRLPLFLSEPIVLNQQCSFCHVTSFCKIKVHDFYFTSLLLNVITTICLSLNILNEFYFTTNCHQIQDLWTKLIYILMLCWKPGSSSVHVLSRPCGSGVMGSCKVYWPLFTSPPCTIVWHVAS